MSTTYAQKSSTVQKVADSKAASLFDSSSQSESLQRKADMTNAAAQREEAPRPNNTGMPDNLKAGIESLSGFSMDDVRVHYNSSKPASVQALAYTQGTDIHVAPGQEKCLPHEAWHVAQQMAGRVSPTTNINGMPVNDNAGLEHEADVMGDRAISLNISKNKELTSNHPHNNTMVVGGASQFVGQREKDGQLEKWSNLRSGDRWYRKVRWDRKPNDDTWHRKVRWYKHPDYNKYYYHISPEGIPEKAKIDPMYNNKPSSRLVRGDDLGPGFYMGDSNFLPYYYKKNFIDSEKLHIYYIEKKIIESENMKRNTTNFTENNNMFQITENNDLFQIAMQLGFRYVKENDVNNHQRPLDLLDPKKTDALASEKMRKFKECVEKIYGDEAKKIFPFFEVANGKAIWKGYINNIDVEPFQITLTEKDLKDFFFNKLNFKTRICAKLLASVLPKDYNRNFANQFRIESETKIRDILSTLNLLSLQDYYSFVEEKTKKQETLKENDIENFFLCNLNLKTQAQNCAESLASNLPKEFNRDSFNQLWDKSKTIIRNTCNKNSLNINSLAMNTIYDDYEVFLERRKHYTYNYMGKETDVKPIQIAIRKDVTYNENDKEVSLLGKIKENVITITKEEIELTRTRLKTAGTKPKASGDLKNQLKTVLAVAKEEKIAEDSSNGNE